MLPKLVSRFISVFTSVLMIYRGREREGGREREREGGRERERKGGREREEGRRREKGEFIHTCISNNTKSSKLIPWTADCQWYPLIWFKIIFRLYNNYNLKM